MKKIIAIIAATVALAGCQPNVPPIPQILGDGTQAPAPQAQADSGISPLGAGALGAAAGYFLGKAGSNNNRTVVIERDRPSYNNYNRPRTVTQTTTTSRSGLTGRTVTRTVTRRSR